MTTKNPYEGKVRIRICGVLKEEDQLLLVRHSGLGKLGFFWSPPGGGTEFGENHQETLRREFREETGLEVRVEEFLGFHEHIDERFHALELFFRVRQTGGLLLKGTEPESAADGPSIEELAWFSIKDLNQLPEEARHSLCLKFLA